MLHFGNIPHNRIEVNSTGLDFSWSCRLAWVVSFLEKILARRLFPIVDKKLRELLMVALLSNPIFWDKKIRIALLTLATYMALC